MAGIVNLRKSTTEIIYTGKTNGDLVPEKCCHWPLFMILAVGLALRVAYILSMRSHPMFEPLLPVYDMTVFHEWAKRIASGELIPEGPFYQAPLYPYFLGAVYAVAGPNVLIAKLLQALTGTASLWLVYLLGRRLFDSRAAGLWAASLMAVTPVFPFYEGFFLRVTLVTFLNLAFLWSLARFDGLRLGAGAALSGALLGLAALARANILVMLPVALAWTWSKSRKPGLVLKARAPALFLLATMLVISPATIHNRLSGGGWALVSTNAAENWQVGNSYDSSGGFCYPEKGLIPVLSMDFFKLQSRKLGMLVSDYEEPNNLNYYLLKKDNLIQGLPLLSWGFFMIFGLTGFLLSWSRRRQLFPIYGYLVLYGLSLVAFFVTSRFRVPLWPALILPSGYALSRVVEAFRNKRMVYATLALAVPLMIYIGPVRAAPRKVQVHYFDNQILLCQRLGDTRGERETLEAKLEQYPDDPPALLRMAHYMQLERRDGEVRKILEKVLSENPDKPEVLRAAGFLELRMGNRKRSADIFERYLELNPQDPDSALIHSIVAGERFP
jgi:Dolichyl-phosphate-mannose-protein mannosyltransferase